MWCSVGSVCSGVLMFVVKWDNKNVTNTGSRESIFSVKCQYGSKNIYDIAAIDIYSNLNKLKSMEDYFKRINMF
jgi:hypothetical protein